MSSAGAAVQASGDATAKRSSVLGCRTSVAGDAGHGGSGISPAADREPLQMDASAKRMSGFDRQAKAAAADKAVEATAAASKHKTAKELPTATKEPRTKATERTPLVDKAARATESEATASTYSGTDCGHKKKGAAGALIAKKHRRSQASSEVDNGLWVGLGVRLLLCAWLCLALWTQRDDIFTSKLVDCQKGCLIDRDAQWKKWGAKWVKQVKMDEEPWQWWSSFSIKEELKGSQDPDWLKLVGEDKAECDELRADYVLIKRKDKQGTALTEEEKQKKKAWKKCEEKTECDELRAKLDDIQDKEKKGTELSDKEKQKKEDLPKDLQKCEAWYAQRASQWGQGEVGACNQCLKDCQQKDDVKYTWAILTLFIVANTYSTLCTAVGFKGLLRFVTVPDVVAQWGLAALAAVGLVAGLAMRLMSSREGRHWYQEFQPLLGLFFFPSVACYFSHKRDGINWRTVISGISLAILVALTMRLNFSKGLVSHMGDLITAFLDFSVKGANMVFGADLPTVAIFAAKIIPSILCFSSFVSVCYYVGVLQVAIMSLGKLLRNLLGVTTTEAVSAAGNIFLGMCEVPVLIKPLLPTASMSELALMMTCGYASVAGAILSAYIGMGIKADYLMLSCIMCAPMGIAFSKLVYPDGSLEDEDDVESTITGETREGGAARPVLREAKGVKSVEEQERQIAEALKTTDGGIIEAMGNGAISAIGLCATLGAMLIAFVSLIDAANQLVKWFLGQVGIPNMTGDKALGYLFSPLAFLLGVEWNECIQVGTFIARKIVVNEFLAYSELGVNVRDKLISQEGEIAATFALCGFANLGSIGMQLGALSAICPERRGDMVKMVSKTMFVGCAVSLANACIAMILVPPAGDGGFSCKSAAAAA